MNGPGPSRRAFLGAMALLPLAGCVNEPMPGAAPSATARPAPPARPPQAQRHERLVELERRFDARLGLYALDTGDGRTVEHRADERFAFCSTFKGLATAAVLQRNPLSHLDTVVKYSRADVLSNGRVTREHVDSGMTIGALCDAAVRFSDGTAGTLLLRDLGGPGELTAFARSIGDTVSRMDRIEPHITEATPGDPRDTTSPKAFGTDYQRIVLGDVLPAEKREVLRDLLERNTTGARRGRAGVPAGWPVADKTGSGDYGTANDFAIVRPPGRAPLVVAIMSSKALRDAEYDEALLAEAAAYAVRTLTGVAVTPH